MLDKQPENNQSHSFNQHTLPARYYISPEYFAKEREKLFFGQWFCAGRKEEVSTAGKYFLREIGEESLILTQDELGNLKSFFNVCRHRGTRLCDKQSGTFTGRISCPYHAWNYALNGELVGAPHMNERADFSLKEYPLHEVAIEEWEGHLWVNFSKNAPPLKSQLGELENKFSAWNMPELLLGHRITYSVKANWKLIIQNYSECLHCPVIHPNLKKLTHYMSGENEPLSPRYSGGSMALNESVASMTTTGKTNRKILPGLDEKQRRHVYYYWLNPNLLLSLHPDYVMTHTLWPKTPSLTEVVCEWHFHPSEFGRSEPFFDDAVSFWDEVNREDWKVSELSQLGISSVSYRPGPYSPREGLLLALDQILTTQVEGPR